MTTPIKYKQIAAALLAIAVVSGCSPKDKQQSNAASEAAPQQVQEVAQQQAAEESQARFDIYAPVALNADLSDLSDDQRQMIGLLIEASQIMDRLFWLQSYGSPEDLLSGIEDARAREFAKINYGPWDRLDDNEPFIEGYGPKPLGARFYPEDMTKAEFEAWDQAGKDGLYSLVRRDEDGKLKLVPYHEAYKDDLQKAADLLQKASELAEDKEFGNYLRMRAKALVSDDFRPSDMAWMDMKNNRIDVVIGPIENYEDQLFAYRTAYESYVLLKDMAWSEKLAKYAAFLPELQKGLPVEEKYKAEVPGTDSDLNAYDVLYYAGHSNAGSKTIAINLPNDEEVQLAKGTRRLQLKNAMRAKFDKILVPISEVLIAEDQRKHITFPAFFANTMFHEVAHGLGIKKTVTDGSNVRQALKETSSSLEEGKADILGLYMVTELHNKGEIEEGELMDNYVTFLASIFRSVRFGAASAHGKANMVRFNYFKEQGAFTRDSETGQYRVDFEKMQKAMTSLSNLILTIQGDGNYEKAKELLETKGVVGAELQADLDRLSEADIPVDVTFIQGKEVLGLQ
ncbi:Zn-dependent hydrolase [Microbulbifer thermotolerans]|uniref:dipeptidyl-peptidase 3 family protein n=1 Tax=Microbulbifer thermotolerans TaxID=252514 RepID=UPI00224954FC|nr:Zn-dependent hydrolase [Microbulbifer thermotolerans]MCX2781589.1 Zn-dependent hydrolase [Microbulbifer thermotolerans]MCX2830937.1 Zn-dependent hydrolase [Microbulbifer thermotolerans]MCX2834578.1 Zn-dependent hydrolase [Microbulbifer thermotolerans]